MVSSSEMVCQNRNVMPDEDEVLTLLLGDRQNIEVVLYNQESMYGKVHILRHSPDPVAVSIAEQELLELIGLVPNIRNPPELLIENSTSSISFTSTPPNTTAMLETA